MNDLPEKNNEIDKLRTSFSEYPKEIQELMGQPLKLYDTLKKQDGSLSHEETLATTNKILSTMNEKIGDNQIPAFAKANEDGSLDIDIYKINIKK